MSAVVEELSVVAAAIVVEGLSLAICHVVLPESLVLVARLVEVLPIPICYVIPEVSFEVISILFDVPPPALAPTINELPLKVVSVVVLDGPEAPGFAALGFPNVGPLDGLQIDALAGLEPRFLEVGQVR